jgi:tRNA A37 threonylcarbamoyladenosine dehydratase
MKERILDIHPACLVRTYQLFYGADMASAIDLSQFDYIVDAIDTVSAKLELICLAKALGVPIISAMGAANKWDPTGFRVADIYETKVCPLAKVMRRELRKRGVDALKVVYSQEVPMSIVEDGVENEQVVGSNDLPAVKLQKRVTPASNAFVPPVAGLILASEVISDLLRKVQYEL